MSLITDVIFVKALRSNYELIEQLPAGDVYNTAIALPEEEADNAPVPYIIVSFDGLQNQDQTKDDDFEAESDGQMKHVIFKSYAGEDDNGRRKSNIVVLDDESYRVYEDGFNGLNGLWMTGDSWKSR